MKNVLRRVLFVFMLVFSISSWGKNLVSVIKVEKGDAKSLHINLSDFTQTSFFKINDENDFTLYKENIKNIDFSKKYDLSGLKNGNYFIEFHEDMLIRTILFKIENNEILLEEKEEIILYRPFIRMKGAIFSICRSILDKNGDLEILLYDDSKNLIYEGLLDHNYPKGRMYDISCLDKGNYQLVMKSKGTVFIESIEKE